MESEIPRMDSLHDGEVPIQNFIPHNMVMRAVCACYRFLKRYRVTISTLLAGAIVILALAVGWKAIQDARLTQIRSCQSSVRAREDLRDLLIVSLSRSTNPESDSVLFFKRYLDEKLPPTHCVHGVVTPVGSNGTGP